MYKVTWQTNNKWKVRYFFDLIKAEKFMDKIDSTTCWVQKKGEDYIFKRDECYGKNNRKLERY